MKRWAPWFLLVFLVAGWVVKDYARADSLLADSDTKVLLEAIRERQDPLSWFGGDWPLENHFYRPVSTLAFELDNAVHGNKAAGYGLTNALIAALCILLTFWFFREVTDRPWMAGIAGALFGFWNMGMGGTAWIPSLFWLLAVGVWLGLARGGRPKLGAVVVASLGCAFVAGMFFLPHGGDVASRIVNWLPGRTASVMLVFCLLAMASYARYERLTAGRREALEPTATDLPATKGTVAVLAGKFAWGWVVLSLVGVVLALGSYEQAVVLPGVLTGIAVLFVTMRRKPHWGVVGASWGLLVGYLLLRSQLVPSEVSGYQAQQFRSGPAVYLWISDLVLPMVEWGRAFWTTVSTDLLIFLTTPPWTFLVLILGNVAAYWIIWKDRDRWMILFALSLALVTYLPMAWLKHFGHYMYWPLVFWALYAVLLIQAVGRRVTTAIAPPAVQAPSRPDPVSR